MQMSMSASHAASNGGLEVSRLALLISCRLLGTQFAIEVSPGTVAEELSVGGGFPSSPISTTRDIAGACSVLTFERFLD